MGRLWIMICIVCSALWIPISLYSALKWARLSFSCISPDNSNVRITWLCSLFASLLAELFPSYSSKRFSISLTMWSCLHYLQGRLNLKRFKRSEEPECEWKRYVLAFILHQSTLSLSLSLAVITAQLILNSLNWIADEHAVLPCCELHHFCCWSRAKAFYNYFYN